ncbi:hypothetical protein [Rhizobium hidalgonense]|uniref:hypothetical protein n=1 Tax=Rhizobium hidalgonense TaxID=1538159 RepID=UPI0013FD4A9F|nr:hypothetical protein [Rhizobium hidalgonense]
MLVVSRLSAKFRSIHYAIFLARNVNTMATSGGLGNDDSCCSATARLALGNRERF